MKKTMTRLALMLWVGGCSSNTVTADGGTVADQSSHASMDLSAARRGSGDVQFSVASLLPGAMSSKSTTGNASFRAPPPAGNLDPCTNTIIDVCKIAVCPKGTENPDAGRLAPPSAGAISISGGNKTAMMTPQADGFYDVFVERDNTLWNGGEQLTIASAGNVNGVPAFATQVVGPSATQLLMPAAPTPATDDKLRVNRSQDLALVWTGGAGSSLEVWMAGGATNATTIIVCSFPATSGMGTIPSAALAKMPAGLGSIAFGAYNSQAVSAGRYDVAVTLRWASVTSDGKGLAAYQATFQ